MPRLFAALALPHDAITHLSMLRGGLPGAQFVDTENYHITLRFIGDVENHVADEIVVALEGIKAAPFDIKIEGLDVFGSKKPRSLFARVKPTDELTKLNQDIERMCQRLKLPADGRKFIPHVTLARLRDISPQSAARFLANNGALSVAPYMAKQFHLMSSRDSIGGGPYIYEETYDFSQI